jgi:hypothetical protein
LKRIKALEDAQSLASVESVLVKIANYGFHREEDFDKYEALRLMEQLAVTARFVAHQKAPSYDVIASTLRQKLPCSVAQFKAYFTALLADKDYGRILDALHKVDKALKSNVPEKPPPTSSAAPLRVNLDPFLVSYVTHAAPLGQRGNTGLLLVPTKRGFSPAWSLPWDLWAFRFEVDVSQHFNCGI